MLRTIAKYLSVALLIIVGFATALSGVYAVDWTSFAPRAEISLSAGQLTVLNGLPSGPGAEVRIVRDASGHNGFFSGRRWAGAWRWTIPLWPLLLVLVLIVVWLWWLDDFRIRPGCCRSCGYDMRHSRSGVCPECGGTRLQPARAARWFGPLNRRSITMLHRCGVVISILIFATVAANRGLWWWFDFRTPSTGAWWFRVPFWLPLAIVLVPTMWLWWKGDALYERRAK